jgi:SepF-like predicted cell division protein (DUF552 family)
MLKCSACGFENKVNTCTKCGSTIQRYVKAIPLSKIEDASIIKKELEAGNVLVVNIVPFLVENCLVSEDYSKLSGIINELMEFAFSIGGDAARIGKERLIFAPSSIRIWDSTLRERMGSSFQEGGY